MRLRHYLPGNKGSVLRGRCPSEPALSGPVPVAAAPVDGFLSPQRLTARLAASLNMVPQSLTRPAILAIQLDHPIRDLGTHGGADAMTLLAAAAGRLLATIRRSDLLARHEHGHFEVLAEVLDDKDAAQLAERLVDVLERPYLVNGRVISTVSARIGIALSGENSCPHDRLRHAAGTALRSALREDARAPRFYNPGAIAAAEAAERLEEELRRAVALGSFEIHYQPIVPLRPGGRPGYEALLRWRHPIKGLIAPGDFLPVAEATGLIGAIGTWVLRQACVEAAGFLPANGFVAVNVSPVQFQDSSFPVSVANALSGSGLSPAQLELELTETALLGDTGRVQQQVDSIQRLGVRLALDDFGTGYSSLALLQRVRFRRIKIDRSFVTDLGEAGEVGDRARALVRMVAALSESIGACTTVEGIETEAQLQAVQAQDLTSAQGDLLGRPMPVQAGCPSHRRVFGAAPTGPDASGNRLLEEASADLFRLVYVSRKNPGQIAAGTADPVEAIRLASEKANARLGITGALFHTDNCFAQVLEGSPAALHATFERIERDPRHRDVVVLEYARVATRTFAAWSMGQGGHVPGLSFDALALGHDGAGQILSMLNQALANHGGEHAAPSDRQVMLA